MKFDQVEPMQITFGPASGVYCPRTELIKLTVDGETMTLAIDALLDNPMLIDGFPAAEGFVLGWLCSHVTHNRQVLAWLMSGVLHVDEGALERH